MGTAHTVQLAGDLPAGWPGRLASALSARGVSVRRGKARRAGVRGWLAELELEAAPGVDLSALDYTALAAEEPPAQPELPLRLDEARVERSEADLRVDVRGPDELGILGRLLGLFALFGLFPHEMRLETVGGEVRDTFRLQAWRGGPPSPEAAEGVLRALEAAMRARQVA
jgi:hypothetical protein